MTLHYVVGDSTATELHGWIASNWSTWTGGTGKPGSVLTLTGRKAGRRTLLVFGRDESRPALIVKLATELPDQARLRNEAIALSGLRSCQSSTGAATFPHLYGMCELEDSLAIASQALSGRRLEPARLGGFGPVQQRRLRNYIGIIDSLSARLAALNEHVDAGGAEQAARSVEAFAALSSNREVSRLALLFAEAVRASDFRWVSGWQHGDPSTGNVLVHGGSAVLIDWEDARPDYPSWLDLASVPLAVVHMAAVQQRVAISPDAITIALGRRSMAGRAVASELAGRWRYPIPIGWAVTLACVYLAVRPISYGAPPVRHALEVASALLADGGCRDQVPWAAPCW